MIFFCKPTHPKKSTEIPKIFRFLLWILQQNVKRVLQLSSSQALVTRPPKCAATVDRRFSGQSSTTPRGGGRMGTFCWGGDGWMLWSFSGHFCWKRTTTDEFVLFLDQNKFVVWKKHIYGKDVMLLIGLPFCANVCLHESLNSRHKNWCLQHCHLSQRSSCTFAEHPLISQVWKKKKNCMWHMCAPFRSIFGYFWGFLPQSINIWTAGHSRGDFPTSAKSIMEHFLKPGTSSCPKLSEPWNRRITIDLLSKSSCLPGFSKSSDNFPRWPSQTQLFHHWLHHLSITDITTDAWRITCCRGKVGNSTPTKRQLADQRPSNQPG